MGEVSTIVSILRSRYFRFTAWMLMARGDCKRISRAKVLEFFATLSSCLVGVEACPSAHH